MSTTFDPDHDWAPDEGNIGWESFAFKDEHEANEFFLFAEVGMIEEASAVVDRVYERMFGVSH